MDNDSECEFGMLYFLGMFTLLSDLYRFNVIITPTCFVP